MESRSLCACTTSSTKSWEKVIPYGVYDTARNEAW